MSPAARDALEGKGPQRRPQRRLGRRLEVAKAVGGGYCRLQMPLRLALAVRGTVAGHRLGALEGGAGVPPPPSNASLPAAHPNNAHDARRGIPCCPDDAMRGVSVDGQALGQATAEREPRGYGYT